MRIRYYLEGILWRISGREATLCELMTSPADNICTMLKLAYTEKDEKKRKLYIMNAFYMGKRMDNKLRWYKHRMKVDAG